MASKQGPSEWSDGLLLPLSGQSISIFGDQQITMSRDGSVKLIEALVHTGLCESLGDAKKAIKNNGVSVNRQKVNDLSLILTKEHALPNIDAIVLERGKYNFGIIKMD